MKKYLLIASLLVCIGMQAEDCLYPELDGKKGEEIRTALYNHIKNPDVLGYDGIRADKAKVDLREDGTVWDIYSDCTFAKSAYCGAGTDYEACDCYNREHILPQSWWANDNTQPMRFDLHNVYPTDYEANSNRSAWPLGEVSSVEWTNGSAKLGYGTFGSSGNNKTFEPADEYKGDIARIYFYMATCYKDKNFTQGGKGYKVFSNGTANFTTTALNLYLNWHREDPVSQKEIDRNNGVAKKQGNRNPFVDDPELVEYIWGNKKTTVYTCNGGQSAVEGVNEDSRAPRVMKVIENGHLFLILPDGTRYTATGVRVE